MLNTLDRTLNTSNTNELKNFGDKISKFGVNFAICDAAGQLRLLAEGGRFKSDPDAILNSCSPVVEKGKQGHSVSVIDNQFLIADLEVGGETGIAAVIDLGDKSTGQDAANEMRNQLLKQMFDL